MHRQGTAIARRQLVEPLSQPIAAQRLVTGDALGKQQSLDAIDVLDPLGDQHFALAAEAAPDLLPLASALSPSRTPEVRRAYTPVTREARASPSIPVCLGAPPSTRRRDRRRIRDDMAFDAFALQHPMKPRSQSRPAS